MSYFQNVSDGEFLGNLVLSDRQFTMMFKIKGALPNSSQLLQAGNAAPYDVSSSNTLTLNYSFDAGNSWTALAVDVSTTAAHTNAAQASEIVSALLANATFKVLFTASVNSDRSGVYNYPVIESLRPREQFKVYITNGNAEKVLRFNKRAGVAELPDYFERHTIGDKSVYPDSVGMLLALDPTTTQDQQIISEAGFAYNVGLSNSSSTATIAKTAPFQKGDAVVVFDGTTTLSTTISNITTDTSLTLANNWTGSTGTGSLIDVHADWQLLRGRSGLFMFQKNTVDSSSRITQTIEYSAGALPGDLAKKTNYTYTSSNTAPDQVTEIPYVLTAADLIVP